MLLQSDGSFCTWNFKLVLTQIVRSACLIRSCRQIDEWGNHLEEECHAAAVRSVVAFQDPLQLAGCQQEMLTRSSREYAGWNNNSCPSVTSANFPERAEPAVLPHTELIPAGLRHP